MKKCFMKCLGGSCCLEKCVGENLGLLTNGEFDKDTAINIVTSKFAGDETWITVSEIVTKFSGVLFCCFVDIGWNKCGQ